LSYLGLLIGDMSKEEDTAYLNYTELFIVQNKNAQYMYIIFIYINKILCIV